MRKTFGRPREEKASPTRFPLTSRARKRTSLFNAVLALEVAPSISGQSRMNAWIGFATRSANSSKLPIARPALKHPIGFSRARSAPADLAASISRLRLDIPSCPG